MTKRSKPWKALIVGCALALVLAGSAWGHHNPRPRNPCFGHTPPPGYTVLYVWKNGTAIAQKWEHRRHLSFLWQTYRDPFCYWSKPKMIGKA